MYINIIQYIQTHRNEKIHFLKNRSLKKQGLYDLDVFAKKFKPPQVVYKTFWGG